MILDILRIAPRALVTRSLRAARLPLTAAEQLASQQGNEAWPPTLAFESAQANVETLVGSLLRDPALTESGRLRQAKVAELRRADQLEAQAQLEKEQARQAELQRKAEIAEQRKQTMQAAKRRKEAVEQQRAAEEHKAEAKARKRTTGVHKQQAKQEELIERRERAGRAKVLDTEAKALEIVKEALEADEKVDIIDATLEGNKEARKAG